MSSLSPSCRLYELEAGLQDLQAGSWARSKIVCYAVKRADKNTELRRQNSEKSIRLRLSRKI